jgi:lipid-A-disaccharide synthase
VPLIFLIAGEPSGDALGARLMAALKRVGPPDLRFAGVGGERMIAEGLASLFPMSDLSVMGLAEVVPRIPRLMRRMRQTARAIREQRPDAVVTIDAPDFCKGVWKRLGRRDRPRLIHYVAPTVWAWRSGRAKTLARRIDRLLCLLPFEPPYFEKEGLAASFVGHPVLESGAGRGDGAAFRKRHRISDDAKLLCVLPGSRRGEVKRMLPAFAETVAILHKKFLNLAIVMPTVAAVADGVRAAAPEFGSQVLVVEGDAEKYDAMAASDAALAASGTVALELGLARVPMVIAYRVNALTAAVVRRMIKVRYATITNLLLDREAVPELIQEDCRPDRLAVEVSLMIEDRAVRAAQMEASAKALAMLGAGDIPPSERAARVVLAEIGAKIAAR